MTMPDPTPSGINDIRSEPFDVFVRRIVPDYADLILAEVERLREESSRRREALAELTCYIEVGDLHPDVQDRIDAALREPPDITAP